MSGPGARAVLDRAPPTRRCRRRWPRRIVPGPVGGSGVGGASRTASSCCCLNPKRNHRVDQRGVVGGHDGVVGGPALVHPALRRHGVEVAYGLRRRPGLSCEGDPHVRTPDRVGAGSAEQVALDPAAGQGNRHPRHRGPSTTRQSRRGPLKAPRTARPAAARCHGGRHAGGQADQRPHRDARRRRLGSPCAARTPTLAPPPTVSVELPAPPSPKLRRATPCRHADTVRIPAVTHCISGSRIYSSQAPIPRPCEHAEVLPGLFRRLPKTRTIRRSARKSVITEGDQSLPVGNAMGRGLRAGAGPIAMDAGWCRPETSVLATVGPCPGAPRRIRSDRHRIPRRLCYPAPRAFLGAGRRLHSFH